MLKKGLGCPKSQDLETRLLCRMHALYSPNLFFDREKGPPDEGFFLLDSYRSAAKILEPAARDGCGLRRQFAPPKEVWLPGENPKSIGKVHYIRPFVGLREDRNLAFWLRADEASCRDSA